MRGIARILTTLVMDVLVVVAFVVLASVVIEFFGQLGGIPLARLVGDVSRHLVMPIGLESWRTPYGGSFDVDAAATVVLVLVAEWVVGSVRRLMRP